MVEVAAAVVKRMAILNSALRRFSFCMCIFISLMARFTCVVSFAHLQPISHYITFMHIMRKSGLDLFTYTCIFYVYVCVCMSL